LKTLSRGRRGRQGLCSTKQRAVRKRWVVWQSGELRHFREALGERKLYAKGPKCETHGRP
jgi:hypothetical protein